MTNDIDIDDIDDDDIDPAAVRYAADALMRLLRVRNAAIARLVFSAPGSGEPYGAVVAVRGGKSTADFLAAVDAMEAAWEAGGVSFPVIHESEWESGDVTRDPDPTPGPPDWACDPPPKVTADVLGALGLAPASCPACRRAVWVLDPVGPCPLDLDATWDAGRPALSSHECPPGPPQDPAGSRR